MDSRVSSAQGHFTKNTDLFPRKVSNSLNRRPMKAVVRDGQLELTKMNNHYKYPSGNVVRNNKGLEYDLLLVVLQKLNKTYVRVPKPENFEMRKINRYRSPSTISNGLPTHNATDFVHSPVESRSLNKEMATVS